MCFPPILLYRFSIDTNAPSIIHRTNPGKSCISPHKHCIPVCFYCIHPPLSVGYQSSAQTNRCCFLLVVVTGMSVNVFVCESVCVVVHRLLLMLLPEAWDLSTVLLIVNDITPLYHSVTYQAVSLHRKPSGYHSMASKLVSVRRRQAGITVWVSLHRYHSIGITPSVSLHRSQVCGCLPVVVNIPSKGMRSVNSCC